MSLKNTDVRTPGAKAIAAKWNLPLTKVYALISQGAKVEFEHNRDLAKAKQVARDHINERPDYYKMLRKAELSRISMKEENSVNGIRGFGNVTGNPAAPDYVQKYINSNSMSYDDQNGNNLKTLRDRHLKHHKELGFNSFDPTKIKTSKNTTLKEMIGIQGTEGLDNARAARKNDMKENKKDIKETGQVMSRYTERPMYEEDIEEAKSYYASTRPKLLNVNRMPTATISKDSKPQKSDSPAMQHALDRIAAAFPKGSIKVGGRKDIKEVNTNLAGVTPKVPTQNIRQMVQGGRTPPMGKPNVTTTTDSSTGSTSYSSAGDEASKYAMDRQRHLDLNKDAAAGATPTGTTPAPIKGSSSAADDMEARRQAGIRGTTDPDTERAIQGMRYGNRDTSPGADGSTGRATPGPTTPGSGTPSPTTPPTTAVSTSGVKQSNAVMQGKYTNRAPMDEDWQSVNRKDKTDGLSQKAVNAYRREHPGSKLKTAVTEKNPTGKRAARRKSFCSRMGGMKKRLTSAKTARDPDSRINKALRRWNCEETELFETTLRKKIKYAVQAAGQQTRIAKELRPDEVESDKTYQKRKKGLNRVFKESVINEVSASKLGRYVSKASAEKKEHLKGSKPDVKKWWKREHGERTAIAKLTGKAKVVAGHDDEPPFTGSKKRSHEKSSTRVHKLALKGMKSVSENIEEQGSYFHPPHKHTAHLSKDKAMHPDRIVEPGGVKGHVSPTMNMKESLIEETKMDTKDQIEEAIVNILDNDLVTMKENFLSVLQDKAMEKLEERKKDIAAQYFAQD